MQINAGVVIHLDRILIVLMSILMGISIQSWCEFKWAKYWAAPIGALISIIFAYFS